MNGKHFLTSFFFELPRHSTPWKDVPCCLGGQSSTTHEPRPTTLRSLRLPVDSWKVERWPASRATRLESSAAVRRIPVVVPLIRPVGFSTAGEKALVSQLCSLLAHLLVVLLCWLPRRFVCCWLRVVFRRSFCLRRSPYGREWSCSFRWCRWLAGSDDSSQSPLPESSFAFPAAAAAVATFVSTSRSRPFSQPARQLQLPPPSP